VLMLFNLLRRNCTKKHAALCLHSECPDRLLAENGTHSVAIAEGRQRGQLHWLPVWHRVQFKIAFLIFQCLSSNAPMYLADVCQLIADIHMHRLRSTDTSMCTIWWSNNTFGNRCFATAGPRLWNSLPYKQQQCDSLWEFKRLLKTHLLGDHGTLWHFS